jgi:Tfp pilus assembly protein PilV
MRLTDRSRLRGLFLLEALVALVVFALATVALLDIVARALSETGNGHWRAEAFDIASSTVSGMWAEDVSTLPARYDAAASGPGYRALLVAAMRLPGVDTVINAPRVLIEDAALETLRVSVTVSWQPPAERSPHRATATVVLPRH